MNQNSISSRAVETCPTCNTVLAGLFCHNCGEKKLTGGDYSLVKFLQQAVHILTHYDARVFRSLLLLITRPGFLTAEYFTGRRVPYLKPVQLFLLVNIVYFFAVSLFGWNTFATHLDVHLHNGYYGREATAMVESRLSERNITLEDYKESFDHTSSTFSKTLIFTMIPFIACLLQLAYRRPHHYYVEQLVFSIHFFAFLLLYLVGMGLLVKIVLIAIGALWHHNVMSYADLLGTIIVAAGTFFYLILALRRVRSQSWFVTIIKAGMITYFSFWVLWIYRIILFVSCFAST